MSNCYGYVPYGAAALLAETYSVASPATWEFERVEANGETHVYGGVEDTVFSEAQKAELIVLGGAWFPSEAAFTAWLNQYAQ